MRYDYITEGGKTVTQNTATFATWREANQAAFDLNSKSRNKTGAWFSKRTEMGAITIIWLPYSQR